MNSLKVEEYAGGVGYDHDYLLEVARRAEVIWGCPRDKLTAMSIVWILTNATLVFVDGFKVNEPSDLNAFPGVSGAAAVVAALLEQDRVGWLDVEREYRSESAKTDDIGATVDNLLALAGRHPSVSFVR